MGMTVKPVLGYFDRYENAVGFFLYMAMIVYRASPAQSSRVKTSLFKVFPTEIPAHTLKLFYENHNTGTLDEVV